MRINAGRQLGCLNKDVCKQVTRQDFPACLHLPASACLPGAAFDLLMLIDIVL
jgi:hypothetical protein